MWTKMAERGMAVPSFDTAEKRCGTCHGSLGAGKLLAPSLAAVVQALRTPLEIITQMWNHAGIMEERMAEANVAWPVLKGEEMADLNAYLLQGQPEMRRPVRPGAAVPRGTAVRLPGKQPKSS